MFGVSPDSVESHKKFRDKYGFSVNLLADKGKEMSNGYQSAYKRNTFLIDPEGVVRKTYIKVKPVGHAEEVFGDLKDMINC
mgnify:CR=1 FL=1